MSNERYTSPYKSPSYKPCSGCGMDCNWFESTEEEPCWGEVLAVEEEMSDGDYMWTHMCEGHYDQYWEAGPYTPEKRNNNE